MPVYVLHRWLHWGPNPRGYFNCTGSVPMIWYSLQVRESMMKQPPRVKVTYPSRKDSDRPWLPGPPPDRQEILVEQAEADWDSEGLQDLQIPIHAITVLAGSDFMSLLKSSIFKAAIPCITPVAENGRKLLFHCCATKIDEKTIHSFSKMGPSIKFSRRKSYFLRQPAVYWTDSIEFALAWCILVKTDEWRTDCPPSGTAFDFVIYIAELNITSLPGSLLRLLHSRLLFGECWVKACQCIRILRSITISDVLSSNLTIVVPCECRQRWRFFKDISSRVDGFGLGCYHFKNPKSESSSNNLCFGLLNW